MQDAALMRVTQSVRDIDCQRNNRVNIRPAAEASGHGGTPIFAWRSSIEIPPVRGPRDDPIALRATAFKCNIEQIG